MIANPLDAGIRQTLAARAMLTGRDPTACATLSRQNGRTPWPRRKQAQSRPSPRQPRGARSDRGAYGGQPAQRQLRRRGSDPRGYPAAVKIQLLELQQAILNGSRRVIPEPNRKAPAGAELLELVAQAIIPALEISGDKLRQGRNLPAPAAADRGWRALRL